MNYYFQQLFDLLNTRDNHIIIMVVFLSLHALGILLRIVTCTAYRSALFAFRLDAKDIRTRDEIKNIRNGMIRKIAAEYIRTADKSVTRIPTANMVDKHVSSMSLLGWRYTSISTLVEALDNGLVLVGLVLAVVFNEYAFMYGTLAAAGFVLVRLAAAFFDFRSANRQLSNELLIYIDREIGHFFAADAGGAVLRLKSELADAIGKQSAVLKEAIGAIGETLAGAFDKKLVDINVTLQDAMRDWSTALADAGRVQGLMNTSAEKMHAAGNNIMSSSDLLAKYLQGHSNALSDQLSALVSAVDTFKESNAHYAAEQDAFLKQAQYIERNQNALEATLQNYEATLQNVTRSLGDGLGAYLKLHAQTASQAVNDAMTASLDRIVNNNQDVLQRMTTLFDQLREQSRDVSANLLSLHEKLGEIERRDRNG